MSLEDRKRRNFTRLFWLMPTRFIINSTFCVNKDINICEKSILMKPNFNTFLYMYLSMTFDKTYKIQPIKVFYRN